MPRTRQPCGAPSPRSGGGSALTGSTWSAALAVQKAAVRNLAMSLAAELRRDRVHVVTVTIDGVLGAEGFEVSRIAEEYVRLHGLSDGAPEMWNAEVVWRGQPSTGRAF